MPCSGVGGVLYFSSLASSTTTSIGDLFIDSHLEKDSSWADRTLATLPGIEVGQRGRECYAEALSQDTIVVSVSGGGNGDDDWCPHNSKMGEEVLEKRRC